MIYSFLPLTRILGCICTMRPCEKATKFHILPAVAQVSQTLYVECLIQIHIFLVRKYASFGHSAYRWNHFGFRIWEQRTVRSVTPPPHKFVDFHSAATPILTECFDLVNMSRLNENYKICNDMYLILEQKRKFTWKRSKFQYVICKY